MRWTEAEWQAAADSYFEMLALQDRGEAFVKAHVVRDLQSGALRARSKGSVEYLFGNISAILYQNKRGWVVGYVPFARYAAGLRRVVQSRIAHRPPDEAMTPTDDLDTLDQRVATLLGRGKLLPPPGELNPGVRLVAGVRRITRDPAVRAWTLFNASGTCERCEADAPFVTARGTPYLEHHHLFLLAEGGPDTPTNSLAACPNCHRLLHFGRDRRAATLRLRNRLCRFAA